jgi:hypothetical protein
MELNKEQIEFLNGFTKGKWTLNKKTGLVDIEGYFDCSCEELTDFKGVRFGVVTGSFNCSGNNLKSLEGAPQEVGLGFDCDNNNLKSLVGAPQKVGDYFNCYWNKLTSLVGAPQEVGGIFDCSSNKLTSLVGAPQEVGEIFDCSYNKLTSLVGAPQKVGRFDCCYNKLTSLEGAPQKVGEGFYCYNNPISENTLNLVWNTMQEKKIDYWSALCILKSEISRSDFENLEGELEKRLSQDAQKGVSMLGRFGHFD